MEDGIALTCEGNKLSFLQEDWAALLQILEQAWLGYVASQLSHKPEFKYLTIVDFSHSLNHDLTILGCFTTGAALTTEHKKHFLETSESVCRFCGEEDTQRHRMLFCSAHEECRLGLQDLEMRDWPVITVERSLVQRPRSLELWDELVGQMQVPEHSPSFVEHVHVFTDGSTNSAQTVPVSSWSVILADPDCFDTTVVAAGCYRALKPITEQK